MHLQFNISQIVYLEQCAVLKSDRINDKNAKDIEIAHKYTTKKHNAYKHHLNQPFLPFNTESPWNVHPFIVHMQHSHQFSTKQGVLKIPSPLKFLTIWVAR